MLRFECYLYILQFLIPNSMKSYRPTVQEQLKFSQDFSQVLTQGDVSDYAAESDILLQQDYLIKLKTQRQKIEQLWNLYEQNEKKLQRALQDNSKLSLENSRLSQMAHYKQKYEQLKRQFDRLSEYSNRYQSEIESLKIQLAEVIHEKSQIIYNMKHQIKNSNNRFSSQKQQLEQSLTDQESYINQLKKDYQNRETSLKDEIESLKHQIKSLSGELEEQNKRHQDGSKTLYVQLQVKNKEVYDLHHNAIAMEKENKRYKDQIMGLQDHLERRQQQYKMQIDKLKRQIKQRLTEIKQKQSNNKELKVEITTVKSKLNNSEKESQKLKNEVKAVEQRCEFQINAAQDDFCKERAHYEASMVELRSSIDDLMDVKNQLICQNRKLQRILKKKEEHQKIRKQLLKSQYKQIDKLEKIVDKVI